MTNAQKERLSDLLDLKEAFYSAQQLTSLIPPLDTLEGYIDDALKSMLWDYHFDDDTLKTGWFSLLQANLADMRNYEVKFVFGDSTITRESTVIIDNIDAANFKNRNWRL